jgi:NTP pyrophosphatase (non-canonical NTP hydrolase)
MDFKALQEGMLRTAKFDLNIKDGLMVSTLGLVGEAGELCDLVKKVSFHGHSYEANRPKFLSETGDVLWYCVYLSRVIDFSLDGYRNHGNYEYERAYLQKLASQETVSVGRLVNRAALRLSMVASEVADVVEKMVYEDYYLDRQYIGGFLIAALVNIEWLCELFETSIEEIAKINIEKLLKRYPNGWNSSDSINRVA